MSKSHEPGDDVVYFTADLKEARLTHILPAAQRVSRLTGKPFSFRFDGRTVQVSGDDVRDVTRYTMDYDQKGEPIHVQSTEEARRDGTRFVRSYMPRENSPRR